MAKTIIKASDAKGAPKTVKKSASEGKKEQTVIQAKPTKGSALGYRIGAIALWLVAIGCEIFAIMALLKNFSIQFTHNGNTNMVITLIIFIVLDLIFAIIAAQLWKKANHISPPSKKNKFTFYLISELGVIMACICFIPLIIILLKNDKLNKKSKIIVTAIAVVALLITGLASADFNPISAEEKENAEAAFDGETIYWTPFGHKCHLRQECGSLANSSTLYEGTMQEAIESGRTSICWYCRNWYETEYPDKEINWDELNLEELAEEATKTEENQDNAGDSGAENGD